VLIVSLSPGVHIRRLQKLLGASFTTTRYHVERLEQDGEIVRSKDGRYDRLYPAGMLDSAKAVYATFQSNNARKILRVLSQEEPQELTNAELSVRTRLSRSTVSECVGGLIKASLIKRSVAPDGRILFGLQNGAEMIQLLSVFQRNLLSIAADRFIELWDI
jgi:predicted transcriptional regulator